MSNKESRFSFVKEAEMRCQGKVIDRTQVKKENKELFT
jgi:hypothetical protein